MNAACSLKLGPKELKVSFFPSVDTATHNLGYLSHSQVDSNRVTVKKKLVIKGEEIQCCNN